MSTKTDSVRLTCDSIICVDEHKWRVPINMNQIHFREVVDGFIAYYVSYDSTVLDAAGTTKNQAVSNLLYKNLKFEIL